MSVLSSDLEEQNKTIPNDYSNHEFHDAFSEAWFPVITMSLSSKCAKPMLYKIGGTMSSLILSQVL